MGWEEGDWCFTLGVRLGFGPVGHWGCSWSRASGLCNLDVSDGMSDGLVFTSSMALELTTWDLAV